MLRWTAKLRDYLRPERNGALGEMSVLALAHVGDAVFELMARTWLSGCGAATAKKLHSGAVALVSAKSQATAAERVLPSLRDDELAVYKRGRNAHPNTAPHGSICGEYHSATGIEALFGYLYLSGRAERLNEIFGLIVGDAE